MSHEDAVFVLSAFFGMYIAGWCAGFFINFIKVLMEKF